MEPWGGLLARAPPAGSKTSVGAQHPGVRGSARVGAGAETPGWLQEHVASSPGHSAAPRRTAPRGNVTAAPRLLLRAPLQGEGFSAPKMGDLGVSEPAPARENAALLKGG